MTQKKDYLPKDFDIFIGLDVDKKSYELNIRNHGAMNRSKKIPSDPENFLHYIRKQYADKEVICAYEAGPTGFDLYDYLTENGVACLVVSPLAIPKAKNQTAKTNKIDAKDIAENLQLGKLYSIKVPVGKYRELRHLIRVRENYAIKRKKAKQRIKALLLQESLCRLVKDVEGAWSKEYVEQLKKIEITAAIRYRMDMLLMDLEYGRKQTLSANRKLREFCKANPEIEKYKRFLKTIPGIGFIIAVTVLGKIGDPLRLNNVRQIGSFLGMVPWENSTGEEENKGSITHFGNSILRSLLIEGAWSCIRKDQKLRQFYHRVRSRNHPRCGSRKAIVAVARKMTQIIYRVLKEEREYIVV